MPMVDRPGGDRLNVAVFGEVMMRLQTPGYELLTQASSL